jgi:hypothetical protein
MSAPRDEAKRCSGPYQTIHSKIVMQAKRLNFPAMQKRAPSEATSGWIGMALLEPFARPERLIQDAHRT